ncbi:hypothetical protein THRCLA_07361, partial [Thraustotheca clavata]
LDYTDGDPTLWVTTQHAWYKIAGPISGVLPHWSYRKHFTKARVMVEACFHIVSVLREWLPKYPHLSYRAVLQQVIEQSILGRYPLTIKLLIEHYKFIASQLGSLGENLPAGWFQSAFFKQLHRMHESFAIRVAKHEKQKADVEARRLQRERELQQRRQKADDARRHKEETRKQMEKERFEKKKYPMEDLEVLLELPEDEQMRVPHWPVDMTFPLAPNLSGHLLGELAMIYQAMHAYRDVIIGLPAVLSFNGFVMAMIEHNEHVVNGIFIAILETLVKEVPAYTQFLQPVAKPKNFHVKYGLHEQPYSITQFNWPEVLRELLLQAKDQAIDVCYIGKWDPWYGRELVLQSVMSHTQATPFLLPVDFEAMGLADYPTVVKRPMDLYTVAEALHNREYEANPSQFLEDLELIWANAMQYNGAESDIGRTAMNLSEFTSAEYRKYVLEPRRPSSPDTLEEVLTTTEFSQLSLELRIQALSWAIHEILQIERVRVDLATNVEKEFEIWREFRKDERERDQIRRNADRSRREREEAFRLMCINQGIPTNYNNVFSDATKKKHSFIAEFYANITQERTAEEATAIRESKEKEAWLHQALGQLRIRCAPLGKDRFHHRYYVIDGMYLMWEHNDTGAFHTYTKEDELESLLGWLNPKGIRESELKDKLDLISEDLIQNLNAKYTPLPIDTVETTFGLGKTLPLPIFEVSTSKTALETANQAMSGMENLLTKASKTQDSVSSTASTLAEAKTRLLGLEDRITNILPAECLAPDWHCQRLGWRPMVEEVSTAAQLLVLMATWLRQGVIMDLWMDVVLELSRKDWLNLRPKPCRNFCPEIDQQIVYFGNGHAQALADDAKIKHSTPLARPMDTVVREQTVVCRVTKIGYHHGNGDPYAVLSLLPLPLEGLSSHAPGSHLCTMPSSTQKIGRVLLRIMNKLKNDVNAGPFLEPVSTVDFPTYTDIVLKPMDLSTMTVNIKLEKYATSAAFLADIKLIAKNCKLFCDGRFPTLPPMANALVSLAESLVKKHAAELRAPENGGPRPRGRPPKVVVVEKPKPDPIPATITVSLRLENRLPEFIVDWNRYEVAVNRSWKSGEKVRILFRDAHGKPTEHFEATTAGSLSFLDNGLLPWEALRVVWDEDDGSDDSRVNPWY